MKQGNSVGTHANALRVQSQHEVVINAPPESIFPLACPVGELKWIDNWRFDLIYSESGVNENNCIFAEEMSSPVLFQTGGKIYWHTTLHDREGQRIHFLLVSEGKSLMKWEASFEEQGTGSTRVRWSVTLTSLSDEVDKIGAKQLQERLFAIISFLGEALKHYCETGEMLKRG
jgi:hypothetical protein